MQYLKMPLFAALAVAACLTTAARLAAQSPGAEDKLLAVLTSKASADAKSNACRQLKIEGTEKSIPVLAGLLADLETSHAARIALESMPYSAAGAELRKAANKTSGLVRSGILDSLGERRDTAAVPLLSAALNDSDPQVIAAAATALAKIGTSEAVAALDAHRATARNAARQTMGVALVFGADRLLASGHRGEAEKIYAELSQPSESPLLRAAALRGRLRAAGPQATQAVVEGLASDDVLLRSAAAGALNDLSDASFRAIAGRMAKFPAASQAAVLGAVGIRGDKSLAPMVLAATKGSDQTVQLAAVRALAVLDDAAALPRSVEKDVPGMLAGVLKAAEGPERDRAERAVVVACRQIPEAAKRAELIADAIRAAAPADRTALLPLWGRFGGPAAMQAIQSALASKRPELREAGVHAICNWPDASVADQLLQLFHSAETTDQRRRALHGFIRVSALRDAGSDAHRLAMLQQGMGLVGHDEERCYVLERASAVRTVDALRFVAPYLDQPATAQSACKSIVELARHKELREPNQKEFQPALEKVLVTSRDQATVEQARRFLEK